MADIHLPDLNGLEFLQLVRDDPALKRSLVFVLTLSPSLADVAAAYRACTSGYICKEKVGPQDEQLLKLLDRYQQLVSRPDTALAPSAAL